MEGTEQMTNKEILLLAEEYFECQTDLDGFTQYSADEFNIIRFAEKLLGLDEI
jgi:hypothetical protein